MKILKLNSRKLKQNFEYKIFQNKKIDHGPGPHCDWNLNQSLTKLGHDPASINLTIQYYCSK